MTFGFLGITIELAVVLFVIAFAWISGWVVRAMFGERMLDFVTAESERRRRQMAEAAAALAAGNVKGARAALLRHERYDRHPDHPPAPPDGRAYDDSYLRLSPDDPDIGRMKRFQDP